MLVKWKKLILNPRPDKDPSKNLIDSSLIKAGLIHPASFVKIGPQVSEYRNLVDRQTDKSENIISFFG